MPGLRPLLLALACFSVSACTLYHPSPLPIHDDLRPPQSASPRTLDMVRVAILAVQQNPDLLASRRKAAVASAQAFAAGLLPDPQLSASGDFTSKPGFSNAYAFGLAEDLQALLTHGAQEQVAKAAADEAKLNALWDEWQTIEKAATLYAQQYYAAQKRALLQHTAEVLAKQAEHSSQALADGNSTIDQVGADLSAALDSQSQRDSAERDALDTDHELKALLAFDPTAQLVLAPIEEPPTMPRDAVAAALKTVADSRPDLLALKAGYRSQEESVREAVLSQFPAITFGPTRGIDNTNVHSVGMSLTVNLPLFTGARGEIRVQSATRDQLRAEYQARLDQTTADAWRIWGESELLKEQVHALEARLPEFERMADRAQTAYREGNLPAATYVVLRTSLSAREGELFDLKSAWWSDVIALRTNLGVPALRAMPSPPG
jgi:outer membrane protein TolC